MTTTRKTNRSSIYKRIVLVVILVTLLGAGGYLYLRFTTQATDSTTETPLQTAKATTGDVVLFASGTGTVSPAAESSFGFNASGQVTDRSRTQWCDRDGIGVA